MSQRQLSEALGLVETKGLIATIAATDAMCKAANVDAGRPGADRRRLRDDLRPRRRRLGAGRRRRRRRRPPRQRRAGQLPRDSAAGRSGAWRRFSGAELERGIGRRIMKILVANLGSTSFKYRLFDMTDERVLARGGVERIGSEPVALLSSKRTRSNAKRPAWRSPDHAAAVRLCLRQLSDPKIGCLTNPRSWRPSASRRCTPRESPACSASMTACWRRWKRTTMSPRPTIRRTSSAMRLLAEELPQIPLVAAFETGFHEIDRAGPAPLCGATGMGREARHQALGLSRRQPSLHRRANGRACSDKPEAQDHLLSPGRQQFAVRDRGRQVARPTAWA